VHVHGLYAFPQIFIDFHRLSQIFNDPFDFSWISIDFHRSIWI